MDNNKSFYVAGALLGIAHKYDKKFFYTIDTNNDIVEGIFYDFNSSKAKYIECFINKMHNVDEALNDVERYLRDYGFDENRRNPFSYNDIPCNVKPKYVPYEEMLKNHEPITRLGDLEKLKINKAIFNDPATIVFWSDGTKTVVKTRGNDKFDPEKGLAMAISKKYMGNADGWYKDFKKLLPEEKENENDVYMNATSLKSIGEATKLISEALEKISKSSARDAINRIDKAIY